jgi:lipopolysaccharide transport system permease protein
VYFPRLLMPLSAVAVSFVDFLIAFGLFVAIAFYYQYVPDWHLLFLPAFLLLAMLGAFAFGLFFAAVNVRFRDVGQLIPFLIQVGFYVCPIAYSSSLVVGKQLFGYSLEPLYNLNPVVGIIDGFKWSVLRGQTYLNPQSIINSVVIILSMLVLSIIFFRKRENSFVDDI